MGVDRNVQFPLHISCNFLVYTPKHASRKNRHSPVRQNTPAPAPAPAAAGAGAGAGAAGDVSGANDSGAPVNQGAGQDVRS